MKISFPGWELIQAPLLSPLFLAIFRPLRLCEKKPAGEIRCSNRFVPSVPATSLSELVESVLNI